jgi:hypothetical protein
MHLLLQLLKLVLGGWIMASPWIFNFNTNVPAVVSNFIIGGAFVLMALENLRRIRSRRPLVGAKR